MGIQKELLLRALFRLSDRARRDPRWLKKVVTLTLASALVLFLGFAFLLYSVIAMSKNLLADKPDRDLLALNSLVAEKALLLSAEQQQRLAPLVKELALPGLAPERAADLKAQLLNSIPPAQAAKIEAWKIATAGTFFTLPPAAAALVENLTGLSPTLIATKIEAFLAWWQGDKFQNSAELLQKTLTKP